MSMNRIDLDKFKLARIPAGIRWWPARLMAVLAAALIFWQISPAQPDPAAVANPGAFRFGERLTYNVSFERFKNAAYAETYVASHGQLEGKNTVELRMRIKTNDFVGAAFYFVDMSRSTFAAADTGLPVYIRRTSNESGIPKTVVENYLNSPTVNYDLLTMIYRARQLGGTASFSMFEDDKLYNVSLQTTVSEQVKAAAGDFDTSVSTVTSEYLMEKGITNLRINFSQDEARIPVLIRFESEKGEFRAELASARILEEGPPAQPAPVATPAPAATPVPKPKPVPTPAPFVENQPLSSDLPFLLGETLGYAVTAGGQPFASVILEAKQRTQYNGQDSLLLSARVESIDANNAILKLNDRAIARVSPESLAPFLFELNFTGALGRYNQSVQFDQKAGSAAFNGKVFPSVPVGTHSILSMVYAVRSFNLKPSKDLANPVNDTRVAVFLNDGAYVVILRPKDAAVIDLRGRKVLAQEISVATGIPAVDAFNLRIWLSADAKRTPLRLIAGPYQADLVSEEIVSPAKTDASP